MSETPEQLSVETPVGTLVLTAKNGAITALTWGGADHRSDDPVLHEAARQLIQYFNGEREDFELPVIVDGSGLQRDVCRVMSAIPFGRTRTYGDIARELGVSAQAIGQACGGNPVAIIIPCHRVLGSCGLGGFSGGQGIETKVKLLRHESAASLLL